MLVSSRVLVILKNLQRLIQYFLKTCIQKCIFHSWKMPLMCRNAFKIGINYPSLRFENSSCYSALLFNFSFYTGNIGFDSMYYTKSYGKSFQFSKNKRKIFFPAKYSSTEVKTYPKSKSYLN